MWGNYGNYAGSGNEIMEKRGTRNEEVDMSQMKATQLRPLLVFEASLSPCKQNVELAWGRCIKRRALTSLSRFECRREICGLLIP